MNGEVSMRVLETLFHYSYIYCQFLTLTILRMITPEMRSAKTHILRILSVHKPATLRHQDLFPSPQTYSTNIKYTLKWFRAVGDFFILIRVVLLVLFHISYKIRFIEVFVSRLLFGIEELKDKQGNKILNISSKTFGPTIQKN